MTDKKKKAAAAPTDAIPKLTKEQCGKALADVRAAYQELLFRAPDADGEAAYDRDLLNGDMTPLTMRANIMQSQEYKDKHQTTPPPTKPPEHVTAPVLHAEGKIFRRSDNAPWRYIGVSAFQLLDHFAKGKDIAPFLAAYTGFNTLRVWPYVPAKDWGDKAWDVQPVDVTKRFLEHVGALGWTVELTLLTDDDSGRLSWAQSFLPQLAASPKPTNVLIEIANEPTTHKNVDTKALKSACDASGFVYASGNYEKSELAFGKYGVAHTPRDSEWPRKAHDLMEYDNGGGPHAPSDPAHKYPWVGDEPAKTQDVAAPAPPLVKPDDWRAYGGTAALLGAGDVPLRDREVCAAADE